MAQNKSLILAKHPVGLPVPGEDLVVRSTSFDLDQAPPEGGLILKTNYVSFDPYLRGRMKVAYGGYIDSFGLDAAITNFAVSTVVKSDNARFKPGNVVVGASEISEYVLVGKERADKEDDKFGGGFSLLSNPLGLDPKLFVGALGMPGITAYSSFYEIGKVKKGEVIFISAASGAVGQIVGQLAKREGLIVIGSVGSTAKLEFIKNELGFDEGFNYKTEQPAEALKRILAKLEKPGLDIYYDNVGGEQLDAALATMNQQGRIILCGSISQTSKKEDETHSIKNLPLAVGRRLTLRGFIVFDADFGLKYWDEHQKNMQRWIKDGEMKTRISVTEGIDNSAEGLVGMLKGENFGKAVLQIAPTE